MRALGKTQSENKIDGSCAFFEDCLFKNQVSVTFFEENLFLRLLGQVLQHRCLRNLFRTQLSLPSTAAAGTKYFCKSLLVDPCQGAGKLMTSSVAFSLNDTETSSRVRALQDSVQLADSKEWFPND